MGQVAYRRGQPGEAVRLLTQACAADPNNPDAMHQLGGAYLLGGRIGPMREICSRLVELDPLTPSNHCLLGLSWSLGGDPAAALPSHRRAVELDPRSTICRVCAASRWGSRGGRTRRRSRSTGWSASRRKIRWRKLGCGSGAGSAATGRECWRRWMAAERAMAESDEYWSYLTAAAYALVGEEDEALRLAGAYGEVRGWIDYVYFTRHDRFLQSLRGTGGFGS